MVSIVLPVYNAEEYIRKCIESIQGQSYVEWELVIIDNGSTDAGYEICREYAKEDSRIEVFHQYQNRGVSVARNLGLERSSGEFITFIDADDWVEADYLEKLLEIQREHNADMVVCGYQKGNDRDREVGNEKRIENSRNSRLLSVEEYFRDYMLRGNTHCWGVLYRAKKIDDIHFPNKMTIGEDLLYLIHATMKMERIAVSDYNGYWYYTNPKGAMLKKFTHSYMDQLICWQQAKEELIEQYPNLKDRLNSILVVSSLLVVGKIAELTREEQEECKEDLQECLNIVKEYKKYRSIRRYLPKGYPIKIVIFSIAPKFYLKLYGAKKRAEYESE
ncbi:MAG: glycosyltransferase family 2 protein [Lachnospiraceae bacterium]|nr:glycosyltransferase family 2 protein [Lachnospiraceae bacterium]